MYPSACFSENRGRCCREQHTLVVCKEASLRYLSKHPHSSTVCCRAGLRTSICKLRQMKRGCIWRCKISDTWRIYSVFVRNRLLILKKYRTMSLLCFNLKMKEYWQKKNWLFCFMPTIIVKIIYCTMPNQKVIDYH